MTREPKAHDEAPSGVNDHPFTPRKEWWSLCRICGLAQAAHSSTHPDTKEEIRQHFEELRVRTKARRMSERVRIAQGEPRVVRIGYYSDDNPDE